MIQIKNSLRRYNSLWVAMNALRWCKNYLSMLGDHDTASDSPRLKHPVCQLATAAQFIESTYIKWCNNTHSHARVHRKQWEFVYILQCLHISGMITSGKRGLVFGCGREPLPAYLANKGCDILATDLNFADAKQQGWVDSNEHAASLEALNVHNLCPTNTFRKHVSFRTVDMNNIPSDITGFDFLWSSCALEHLGSLEHGLAFIRNAMRCLKPGGVAVHTTEFNLTSDDDTVETPELSVYRKQDMLRLKADLENERHSLSDFNWNSGFSKLDRVIDIPPHALNPDLRIRHAKYSCTSIGILIYKAL